MTAGLFIAAFFAAAGVSTAFMPLWLTDRGVSAAGVGQILGVVSLVRVAAIPAWGVAADRVGQRRPVLFAAAAWTAVCTAALPWADGFAALLGLVALQGVAASALTPLADALTLALAATRRLDYARTRAWGSAAYMAATAAAGPLVGALGTAAIPWLLTAGYAAAAGLAPLLPEPDRTAPAPGLPHDGRVCVSENRFTRTGTASPPRRGANIRPWPAPGWRRSSSPWAARTRPARA